MLFNDLIAIVNQRNEKKELENLMFLQSVFLKDVKNSKHNINNYDLLKIFY